MSGYHVKSENTTVDRLYLIQGIFFLLGLIIVWRLFDLQILKGATKQAEAYGQRAISQALEPIRGEIFTISSIHNPEDLQPVAVNEKRYLVYANPNKVINPEQTAKLLSETLELETEDVLYKLAKENDPYEPILHAVTKDQKVIIEQLDLNGIYTDPETVRNYPMNDLFGHITGFVGFKGDRRVGQYGIEGVLERLLAGSKGYEESEIDPGGRLIAFGDRQVLPAVDGASFILTIDPNIQQTACSLIKNTIELYGATGGSIIVMEPDNGAIRAMCSIPGFDPNSYSQVEDIDVFVNPAVSATYEPGSIFKPITMAAAIDSGSIKADTKFTDTGSVTIGEHTIRNADNKVYGEGNMSDVLEKSINTGTVFAAMRTGREILREYVHKFGFGVQTGITAPSEASGDISALDERGDIFLATSGFGQGITVTPLQMVQAFGAIANQGNLVRPHLLSKIILDDGQEVIVEPEVVEQVISSRTAAIIGAMLVNVTEKGHAKAAQVSGFYVAGKTGTAQVAGNSGYSEDTIHSFIGFAPMTNPRFVILVKLDKPQWGRFSSNTVAPVFADLASYLLQYYQVQPER